MAVGCNVDPYTLGGGDGGVGDDAARPADASDTDGGGDTDAAIDAGPMNDACVPQPEICDGMDNDCDGEIDEDFNLMEDPANCGSCDFTCSEPNAVGSCDEGECSFTCQPGYIDLDEDIESNGCEYPCVPTNGGMETCDFTDNDCDGETDEGFDLDTDVDNCGGCGKPCHVLNATPLCDGGSCTYSECDDGYADLLDGIAGCEYTCPEWPPTDEVCDGVDNDCDGEVDELPIEGLGDDCTDDGYEQVGDTGECSFGTLQCTFGTEACVGYQKPTNEVCDELDNDCDGVVDEDFDKDNDPRYCGGCTPCEIPNAVPSCEEGVCGILTCKPGWVDLNEDIADGCEYECSNSGPEVCDGVDNDCDGLVDTDDPDLAEPSNFCKQNGECSGTEPVCAATACDPTPQWHCDYPETTETDACGGLLLEEQICDDLDGDCDGLTDESYLDKGGECDDGGLGICRGEGVYVCTAGGDALECDVTNPGEDPVAEACNNLDDDCDGLVDEDAPDDMVEVVDGGESFWIYAYEASRPDADGAGGGKATHRSCSRPGVVPWRSVTWTEAADACEAAGKRLCTADEWELACAGSLGNTYPYGDTYDAEACNGEDYDHDCTDPDDDVVLPTGTAYGCPAPVSSLCISDFSAFDLSGNLKEWTATQVGADPVTYSIRGGAYDNIAPGLTCQFDFLSAEPDFYFPNLGFRCCSDTGP